MPDLRGKVVLVTGGGTGTAEAIVYLATNAGVTGYTIIVDGGMTALGPRT